MRAVSHEFSGAARNRRGSALIIAILCAGLCTLMLGTMLRVTMTRARQIRHHERTLQADWLAEAGLERARAMLATQPDYAGETWTMDTKTLGGPYGGVVTITVDAAEQNSHTRTVHVQADYPAELTQRIRKSKQVEMILTTRPAVDTEEAQ